MKLHIDPNQQFQLDTVADTVDPFEGQYQSTPGYFVIRHPSLATLPPKSPN